MLIRKCSNCYNFKVCEFKEKDKDLKYCFIPSEDATRIDERTRTIDLILDALFCINGNAESYTFEEIKEVLDNLSVSLTRDN